MHIYLIQAYRLKSVLALCGLIAAVVLCPDANAAVENVHQLQRIGGQEGDTQIVLGYDQPGDGGGGVFRWTPEELKPDEGLVFAAAGSGVWQRQNDNPIEASWFGAKPIDDLPCLVAVNGEPAGYVALPAIGENGWRVIEIDIELKEGDNTIRMIAAGQASGPYLDQLSIGSMDYEAESFSKQSRCRVASEHKQHTGEGYVEMGGRGAYVEYDRIAANTSGVYALQIRYSGGREPRPSWVKRNTDRLQAALDAAGGGVLRMDAGEFLVSDTLIIPPATRLEGRVALHSHGRLAGRGTMIKGYGEGQARRWQDTGDSSLDTFCPVLVLGGNGITVSHLTLEGWDVGILMPTVSDSRVEYCDLIWVWPVAACLVDATWSTKHVEMIDRHKGKIQPSDGAIDNTIFGSLIKGRTGLVIRGPVGRKPEDYRSQEWIWAPDGVRNFIVSGTRVGASGGGTVFIYDTPAKDLGPDQLAVHFLSCNLRVGSSGDMVELNHTAKVVFEGCYLEGSHKSALVNHPEHSGEVDFIYSKTVDVNFKTWDDSKTTRQ